YPASPFTVAIDRVAGSPGPPALGPVCVLHPAIARITTARPAPWMRRVLLISTSSGLVAASSITIGARIGAGPSFCTPSSRAVPIGMADRACHHASVATLVSRSDRLTRPALLAIWLGAFGFGFLSLLIAQSH